MLPVVTMPAPLSPWQSEPADEVAQEGLDNIANGPVWIVGGERNRQSVRERSNVADRAAAARASTIRARPKTAS